MPETSTRRRPPAPRRDGREAPGTAGQPNGADGYVLDDQVGHLLRRCYQLASGNLSRRIGDAGLTPMQLAALARLREHGEVSQNRLGRMIAMEPANIHALVARLRRRGLLAERADPDHGRRRLLRLTAAGAALLERLLPLAAAATAETLSPLDDHERATLLHLLRRLAAPTYG
jgi:DNA-binding MarR family transcriptional regulator